MRWPRPGHLQRGVSWKPKTVAEAAATLGLDTVYDLLRHLPRDTGEGRTIDQLVEEETATIVVEVRQLSSRTVRRRGMRGLTDGLVRDETGTLKVVFFNQPWLDRRYPPGTRLLLTGRLKRGGFSVSSHAPTELTAAASEGGIAQYPATKGIDSTQILAMVRELLPAYAENFVEILPSRLRVAESLPDVRGAIVAAHTGEPEGARRRLAFDELLLDQLVQLRLRARARADEHAFPLDELATLSATWREEQLPFRPTGDQRNAMEEIDEDLARERPMQRLLMGEVGSGKTVVAVHAMLRAVEHGGQAALMAPTETLAEQHFATLQALMPGALVPIALLTGSTTAARRREILARLASGELAMIVGTHALIEDVVRFAALRVVVVDEQHRFGVDQRRALDQKAPAGLAPHVLHMTATPIPRTMRLASFGALDVTTLRELPKGRRPIATHVAAGDRERARAYDRIREELDAGRQAFVVCPLVGESEVLQARAATAEFERLRDGEFKDYRVVLLHGQMKPAEKAAAMESFAAGEADVLVATTVIEVGIDVPNATIMLVEDAERYGISQLHQLRGRVGRGEHASLCLLFGPKESRRLRALAEHTDGFKLAEIDLELRGEGELTGTRQSGMARFGFARLPEDAELLERAHFRAQEILDEGLDGPDWEFVRVRLDALEAAPVAG